MTSSDDYLFILGNYQLIEVLGIGAMGYVYRARQMNLERDVAVKMLAPKLAQEIGYNDLFIREARMAASLEHPHIVPVFDYGVEHNVSYVAMRLLLGGSLGERVQHRLDRNLVLPSLVETSAILTQAASALDYAHARGVIHRDIKPTNLMFDQHGVVYIVDFGIAKLVGTTTGSMRGGTFMGTPSFMAPEQWQGLNPTPAVDQYALGAVIYMMLTGRPPFEADAALALMVKHLNDVPREVQSYRPGLPAQINPVLQRAMAKQPEDRYPNVMAFAQAFAAVVRESSAGDGSTEFTTYALPPTVFALPFPTPTRPPTIRTDAEATPATTQPIRDSFGRGRSLLLWIESLLLVLAVVLIVLLLSQRTGENVPAPTAAALAATLAASPTPPLDPVQPTSSGGGVAPQSGLTVSASPVLLIAVLESATATPTAAPTLTNTPTETFTPSATPSPTEGFTATPSSTPTETFTPSATPSPTEGFTATPSSTPTETFTATATDSPTATATITATPVPQPRPNVPWHQGSHLRVRNSSGSWLRARASTRAAQVATLAYNNLVTATGNHYFDGRQWWWEVKASWGAVGWVEQYSLEEQ